MVLEQIFYPGSIAVVGASRDRNKVGNIILRNVMSTFTGKVYPVNDKVDSVEGLPAHRSLAEIGERVDLAIISVPKDAVIDVMENAGKAGVKGAIVITSGFREMGDSGARLEEELKAAADKNGVRFLGPNTMGIVTPSFNATFTYVDVKHGGIAIVAQSGGMGAYMLTWAQRTGTGLSYFVGLGNQADISEVDVLRFLGEDSETKAIFVYLEGVSNGPRFLEEIPEVTRRKPVAFLKGGASNAGAAAAGTHTGSLAGSYELFRAAVKSVGGMFVDDLRDLLNLAKLVNSNEPLRGDVLVITNSGGHGVLAMDEISRNSLNPVRMSPRIQSELGSKLPAHASPRNPVDLGGDADAELYAEALRIVQDLDCTKLVIVQALATVSCVEVARAISRMRGKGVVGVVMGMDEDAAARILDAAGVPAFRFSEDAVRAISRYLNRREPRLKLRSPTPVPGAMDVIEGKQYLRDEDAFKLLELYGVRVPPWAVVDDPSVAMKEAERIGFPLVMKISPDEPVHKTDIGGVRLNVERDDVEGYFAELSKMSKRVLLQRQLAGVEVFVGGIKDQVFGPAVLVGLGGIYVEVLRSVSYGLSPISEQEALEIMSESKVMDALTARKRGYDVGSTARAIARISNMIVDLNVKELDVNPLIVNENGAFAVDVRIKL
ncbi:MAG TPA: CoA-binding protein [Nitrososphaeria archaeon]|nr:MAG: acetyl CoA synthetase [Nitrososphaera sp.]HEU16092.1 CoA-binding protein [Nitrososphaeria archaeon]